MKRNMLLISVFMVLCLTLFADTDIPAGNVNGVWNAAGSPYNILGEIQIVSGEQLTIEAGVTVNFTGHFKFIVQGSLLCEGELGNEIEFTADDDVAGWHGLRFLNTDGEVASVLDFCNIEYGRATGANPDNKGGALYAVESSNVTLNYCSISESSAATGGAVYLDDSDVNFNYVEFANNIASGAGGAVYLNNSDAVFTYTEITGNQSVYDGGGVNCFNSNPVFDIAVFHGNFTEWNGGAISVFNNSDVSMDHVVIYGNTAEQNGSAFAILYASSITMNNSIVWMNAYDNPHYVEDGSTFTVSYSDFYTGTTEEWFTDTCINADPLFENAAAGDFQITWDNYPTPDDTKSPCIDAGDPESDNDPDGTIADIGATYFIQSGIQGVIQLDGGEGIITEVEITITNTETADEIILNPDEDGNYASPLEAGTYDIVAELEDYSTVTEENVVISGQLVTLNLTLTIPPPGEIVGQVDVEGIGSVLEVVITAGDVTTSPYAVTDPATGAVLYYEYTLEISPGIYTVTAEMSGYETQTEENVAVQSGFQTTDIDFYLPLIQDIGTITGTVTLINGVGDVEDVVITVGDETTNPAADGTYQIEILNGTYTVFAALDGYSSVRLEDINVTAFMITPDIDFDLINGWETISGTQYNMTLYATITYDGAFMPGGNNYQFGVFDIDGDCRGTAVWEEGNYFFWDNFYTLEGFWYVTIVSDDNSGGELLGFKFYNAEDNTIYDCREGVFFEEGVYDFGVNFTIDSPEIDVEYDLVQGWNWISFYLNPPLTDLDDIFDEIDDVPDAYWIKNHSSNAHYDPDADEWLGSMTDIVYDSGYKLQMINAYEDFTYSGERMNPVLYPINIDEGWNMLPYLNEQSLDIETALQSLSFSDSLYVKTQSQSAVYFGGWIGDLEYMNPGVSYMLNWPSEITPTNPVWLTYPPHDTAARYAASETYNPADWQLINGNQNNMILIADLNTDIENYAAGVFDKDGVCRSIGKKYDDFWYFTIAGNEPELLELHIYDTVTGETIVSNNSIAYQPDEINGDPQNAVEFTFDGNNDEDQNAPQFALTGNYPNPFNPTTEIAYTLAEDSDVVIQVYNVKGQIVETLVNENQSKGEHTVTWNADNMASGVYFYKINTNSFSQMKKCILMK